MIVPSYGLDEFYCFVPKYDFLKLNFSFFFFFTLY